MNIQFDEFGSGGRAPRSLSLRPPDMRARLGTGAIWVIGYWLLVIGLLGYWVP